MTTLAGDFQGIPIYPTIASLPALGSEANGTQAFCTELLCNVYSVNGLWFRLDGTLVTNPGLGIVTSTQGIVHTGTTASNLILSPFEGAIPTTGVATLRLNAGALVTNTVGTTNQVIYTFTIGTIQRTIPMLLSAASASPNVYISNFEALIHLYTAAGTPSANVEITSSLSNPATITTTAAIGNRGAAFPQYQSIKAGTIPAANTTIRLQVNHNTAAATTSSLFGVCTLIREA